jgi:ribosome-associated toxin RatA of RatAB toxin-antitoxin module
MRRVCADDAIEIPGPLPRVWQVVSDFAAYPRWWPSSAHLTVHRVTPELVGSTFELKPYGGKAFTVEVVGVKPGAALHMTYSGIYRGTGEWKVAVSNDGNSHINYRIDLAIADRSTALLSYVLPVSRIHSRLMRHVFEGLQNHLASDAESTPPA